MNEPSYSIQMDFGTEQTQGASVNIHGNSNRVNIEEGQQSTNSGGGSGAVQKLDSESIPTHIDILMTLLIRISPVWRPLFPEG